MNFSKDIINLIFLFDPTYHIIFKNCLIDITNLKPTIIYYGTPSMYKIKNTKPFYGKVLKQL